MEKTITIDFGNLISELESKEINLSYIEEKGMFAKDKKGNYYQIEKYYHNGYLDKYVDQGYKIKFELRENTNDLISRFGLKEKKWSIPELKEFIWRGRLGIRRIGNLELDDYSNNEFQDDSFWTQICNECLKKYKVEDIENAEIDEYGHGICGVKDCNNESDHYVDFYEVEK